MEQIKLSKLKTKKPQIAAYKKKYGTRAAVNYSEGILGLKRGEYMKNRPRIRKAIKGY